MSTGKVVIILTASALLSVASHHLTAGLRSDRSARAESSDASASQAETERLRQELARLEQETARLREHLERAQSQGTPSAKNTGVAEADIADALDRYLAANSLTTDAGSPSVDGLLPGNVAGETMGTTPLSEIATLPMEEILALFADSGMGDAQAERIFEALRKSGRIDEYIAAIEALVEQDPSNPELHTALGVAYLQKLFGANQGPESGILAMKADQSFDQALELDPNNWSARFTKAVSLSNWPAFLGRTGEAIENFETLIAQQEAVDPNPNFAQSYLFLGNMYQQIGEHDKAAETWRKGLTLFPLSEELLNQLGLVDEDQ